MSNTPSVRGASNGNTGLQPAREILKGIRLAPPIGEHRIRKVDAIECVRMRRQSARQNIGFSSRPFVLCGLPVKCPPNGTLVHERRNGQFVLLVTGTPTTASLGGRIASCRCFSQHWQTGSDPARSRSIALRKCSTPSGCNRGGPNTVG